MSNFKFTPQYLYENTNKGLDIIFKYLPDAVGCERGSKMFKFRADENTASATIHEKEECFIVMDFGNKGFNPIAICQYFTGYSFIEALKFLYAEFNLGETSNFINSNTTFKDTDKPIGWFEVIESENYNHLDLVGRFLEIETAKEYGLIPVKSYSFVFLNKKTNLPTLCTIDATDNYPIFAYKFTDTWCKIYQPLGSKKYKHSYLGKKPPRHVYGLELLKSKFDIEIATLDNQIATAKKNKDEDLLDELLEKKLNFKLDSVFICSGGSDGLNVASLGYNTIWYNSEGEQMNFDDWKALNKLCYNVYNLPDIDKAGMKYAYSLAEKFWNLKTIYLPESIKKNNGKDFRDWLKKYATSDYKMVQYHFNNLITGALKLKFFEKLPSKQNNKYKLRHEFLCYFLNVKGFYTYKIEQKNLDNTAPEIIIYIKIEGNVVKKVSPRIIREFAKQYLREKGQPVEVLELVALSTMFNDQQLIGLKQIELDFSNFTSNSQYFFFENNIAEITENEIKYLPQGDFQNYVWEQSVKKHKIFKEKPFFEITKTADGLPKIEILRNDCEYFNFLTNASRVFWRKELETQFGENQTEKDKYLNENRFNISGSFLTDEEKSIQNQHLCNKLFAIGYLMHRYKQDSFAKIIVAMDDEPKELEDEANGGSGKSLMFKGISTLLNNRHWLNGKNEQFKSDRHILQGFTKENDYLIIEDVVPNFDMEFIFEWITGSIPVNPKNSSPYEVIFEDAGKMVLTTNYGLKKVKDSIIRRTLFVTTSDYYHTKSDRYNEERKVCDDFEGYDLFKNWTTDQWNKHYNFLMQCCQLYLNNRGKEFKAPVNNIALNNINAVLGDTFISWANEYFTDDYLDDDGVNVEGTLNKRISRAEMYASYCKMAGKFPKSSTQFKKAIKIYAESPARGWVFNPKSQQNKDGYIKRRGIKEHGEPSQVECFYIESAVATDIATALQQTSNEIAIENEKQASDDLPF